LGGKASVLVVGGKEEGRRGRRCELETWLRPRGSLKIDAQGELATEEKVFGWV